MVFKKTSEEGYVFPRSSRPPGAILGDFDIDGDILKLRHKEWLDDNVIKPANAKSSKTGWWSIDLIGRASKSGSDEHNMWLSAQRVKAVRDHVGPRLVGVLFHFHDILLGESSPYDSSEFEHELDRSVEIRAEFHSAKLPKRRKPVLKEPKLNPWKPRPNRKVMDFRLQVLKAQVFVATAGLILGGGSLGIGFARVKLLINIRELGSSDHAMYEFLGKGTGGILKATPGFKGVVSPDLSSFDATYAKGREHAFATDIEMDADEFAGTAFFMTGYKVQTFTFGPKSSFWASQETIKNLSFGLPRAAKALHYVEAMTSGKMSEIETVPEWAK